MSPSDIRKLSDSERAKHLEAVREQVARLTMRRNARRLDKPSELVAARKDLARVLTIGGEKSRGPVKGVKA